LVIRTVGALVDTNQVQAMLKFRVEFIVDFVSETLFLNIYLAIMLVVTALTDECSGRMRQRSWTCVGDTHAAVSPPTLVLGWSESMREDRATNILIMMFISISSRVKLCIRCMERSRRLSSDLCVGCVQRSCLGPVLQCLEWEPGSGRHVRGLPQRGIRPCSLLKQAHYRHHD